MKMNEHTERQTLYAVCIDNTDYPVSLERHKIDKVVPDGGAAGDGDIRVINESGEDSVYSLERFVPNRVAFAMRTSLETVA